MPLPSPPSSWVLLPLHQSLCPPRWVVGPDKPEAQLCVLVFDGTLVRREMVGLYLCAGLRLDARGVAAEFWAFGMTLGE